MKYFKLFFLFLVVSLSGCFFAQKVEYPNENFFNIDNSCNTDRDCGIVYKDTGCNSCSPCSIDNLNSYVSVNYENYLEFEKKYFQNYCSQKPIELLNCPACTPVDYGSNEGVDLEPRCVDNQCMKYGNEGY